MLQKQRVLAAAVEKEICLDTFALFDIDEFDAAIVVHAHAFHMPEYTLHALLLRTMGEIFRNQAGIEMQGAAHAGEVVGRAAPKRITRCSGTKVVAAVLGYSVQ
jgi:hypothetical protein